MLIVFLINRKDYATFLSSWDKIEVSLGKLKVTCSCMQRVCATLFKAKQWEYLSRCWDLTPREAEVAKLVCEGFDNGQIGQKLHIAYNTVRAHLRNIFRRVGVLGKAARIPEFGKSCKKPEFGALVLSRQQTKATRL